VSQHTVICICNKDYWPKEFGTEYEGLYKSNSLVKGCENAEAGGSYFMRSVPEGDSLLTLTNSGEDGATDRPCSFLYQTKRVQYRCVPQVSQKSLEQIIKQTGPTKETRNYVTEELNTFTQKMDAVMRDAMWSMPIIAFCAAVALISTAVALLILVNFTEFFAKASVVILYVMGAGMVIGQWVWWDYYEDLVEIQPPLATHDQDVTSRMIFLVILIFLGAFMAFYLLFGVYVYSKLNSVVIDGEQLPSQAVSMIGAASQVLTDASAVILFSICYTFFWFTFFAVWLYGAVLMYSAGTITLAANGVAVYEHSSWLLGSGIAYIIGLFWWATFIHAVAYMVVAGVVFLTAFANPKPWNEEEKAIPHKTLSTSFCIVARWHCGTAALGSLMMILLIPVRLAAGLIKRFRFCCGQAEADHEQGHQQGCLFCLQGLSMRVYLMTILHGMSWHQSATYGLISVHENAAVIGEALYISSYVMEVAKLNVAFGGVVVSTVLLQYGWLGLTRNDFSYVWVLFVLVFLTCYLVAAAFLVILEVSIDALCAGYCESTEDTCIQFSARDGTPILGSGGMTEPQLPAGLLKHIDDYRWRLKSYEGRAHRIEKQPLLGADKSVGLQSDLETCDQTIG